MIEVPAEVLVALDDHDCYLLVGHEEPDGDCIASQMALGSFLERRGKRVALYSAGPFDRPEIRMYAPRFGATVDAKLRDQDPVVVVLDCSTPERTGPLGAQLAGLRTLVIDHHSAGVAFGDLRFVVPQAPATALLVQLIIEASGDQPTADEAELLLFGLCTDTGFFRHLPAGSDLVFDAVARLVRHGGNPQATYERIYGNRSLERRRLLGTMLARTEQHLDGRLLFTFQTREDVSGLSDRSRGDDDLYSLLRTVDGSDVMAFAREEPGGGCAVSMRSAAAVDVGEVARALGGGGHRQAAGFTWAGTIDAVRQEVVTRIERSLPELAGKQ